MASKTVKTVFIALARAHTADIDDAVASVKAVVPRAYRVRNSNYICVLAEEQDTAVAQLKRKGFAINSVVPLTTQFVTACGTETCVGCGNLKRGDFYTTCADCAAIFCETCFLDGTLDNHDCSDYDWDDDVEEEVD